MPRHGQRTTEEANAAGSEAFKGAVVGAAKVCNASFYVHPHPFARVLSFLDLALFFTLSTADP